MITRSHIGGAYPTVPLGEVVDFLDHKRRPITAKDRIAGPIPYYGANGQQDSVDDYIFDEPLILVAEDGGHFDNPDRGIAYRISGRSWVNNHAHVLRPHSVMDLAFLCRVLENYDVRPYISGSTRGKLTKGQASKIEVPLPPLPEQRRIAAILDQADALRRLRRQSLSRLSDLGQAIFFETFGDPATNPMGFPMGTIRDLLAEAKYGTAQKANSDGKGLPILRMGNLTYGGQIDLSDLKHVELTPKDFPKYTTRAGDLLFNRTNSKELVGKTAVVEQGEPLAIAGYLIRARTNEKGNPHYISAFLNSTRGKAILSNMCKNIVGMANINAQEMQDISIAVPPIDLQDRFANRLAAIADRRQQLDVAIQASEALFASLQHRAFRGEL